MLDYDETLVVGSVVGYTEGWAKFINDYGVCYVVVGLPDLGNMVEMTEITDLSYDDVTETCNYQIIDAKVVLSVEPWKIGLI